MRALALLVAALNDVLAASSRMIDAASCTR